MSTCSDNSTFAPAICPYRSVPIDFVLIKTFLRLTHNTLTTAWRHCLGLDFTIHNVRVCVLEQLLSRFQIRNLLLIINSLRAASMCFPS